MTCRLGVLAFLIATGPAMAQLAPEVGCVYPPGGKAGTTVNVVIGGSEWTPDMQFFTHDPRVKLEVAGPLSELLIPPPPYWFGAKGRLPSMPLLRERAAKFTLPADLPPGPIRWQAANANGATSVGVFVVGNRTEAIEDEKATAPQLLPALPATVSGRLYKNEEVDRYRFTVAKAGLVTVELTARRLGSNFNGAIEITDAGGRAVAEDVDTEGLDPVLTFAAAAGAEYTVAVRDIDHAGDRSYTYRLTVAPGTRVLTTIPAVGRRGETRTVEFFGIGLATGGTTVESVRKTVAFPAGVAESFAYRLETPGGVAVHQFPLSDAAETLAPVGTQPFPVALPGAVTGILDEPNAGARFALTGKKGDRWFISAEARRFGSPLDLTLRLFGPDGKEIVRNEDLPGTTDAGLDYTVPGDGAYHLAVSDGSGSAGSRLAVYRLAVRVAGDGFTLQVPVQKLSLPLGAKTPLIVKATRTGNFKGPIALTFTGLPAGVIAPPNLVIPADKAELAVTLEPAATAAVSAAPVKITGTATVAGGTMTRAAHAPVSGNLAPRVPEETETLLIAMTMKPRIKGAPVDKDTGRKVARGSTHPADIVFERLEGYAGDVTLKQAARQSYQVQGITGRDVVVPAGATKAVYPCFMPEWLETIRTSRMGIVAEVKLADPKGNVRHLVAPISGFVTMTMEGALLKLADVGGEIPVRPGEPFVVNVQLARSPRLVGPVRLEVRGPDGMVAAEPVVVPPTQTDAEVRIVPTATAAGEFTVTIRGTSVQPGDLPVVSETDVRVVTPPAKKP